MLERKNLVMFKDKEATLVGNELKVGDQAPNFVCLRSDLSEFSFDSLANTIRIISVVPSLDTGICALQTTRFNYEATSIMDVEILTVSMDLPFAQKRFCESQHIDHVTTLSDHKDADFGLKYGLLMKEFRLLARAVIVVDQEGIIRYFHIEDQIKQEPNYTLALDVVRSLL
ncbi:MAG: thiol peroxidase [Erysipelothrix sp.]|nr:thiol peroxidase [Erysipelothrix sp.]